MIGALITVAFLDKGFRAFSKERGDLNTIQFDWKMSEDIIFAYIIEEEKVLDLSEYEEWLPEDGLVRKNVMLLISVNYVQCKGNEWIDNSIDMEYNMECIYDVAKDLREKNVDLQRISNIDYCEYVEFLGGFHVSCSRGYFDDHDDIDSIDFIGKCKIVLDSQPE